jgi:hypothetical protein
MIKGSGVECKKKEKDVFVDVFVSCFIDMGCCYVVCCK